MHIGSLFLVNFFLHNDLIGGYFIVLNDSSEFMEGSIESGSGPMDIHFDGTTYNLVGGVGWINLDLPISKESDHGPLYSMFSATNLEDSLSLFLWDFKSLYGWEPGGKEVREHLNFQNHTITYE